MKYYSITVTSSANTFLTRKRTFNASAPLTIGQSAASSIQVPCPDDLLPQCFCVIIKDSKGDGWQLIKESDFYNIYIDDEPVDYVCKLRDGNVISVDGNTLVFNTFEDDKYIEGVGVVSSKSSPKLSSIVIVVAVLFVLLSIAVVGFNRYNHSLNHFTNSDNEEVRASVYKILVSEILLQQHTPYDGNGVYHTIDTYEPDSLSIGTCFITNDSLLVTARHCIETWIDFNGWKDNTSLTVLPKDVQWAILAERSNLEERDTLYRIVSRCQVMDEDSCIYTFTSDMCSFNKSRDIVAHIGNERHPWRIIYPLYSRKDVELGDFAFIKTGIRGSLTLATDEYLTEMKTEDEGEKRIYGYPRTNHGNLWEYQMVSRIAVPDKEDDCFTQCLQFNVNGTSGYSGAPVIVKRDGQLTVVGIFSKIDDFDNSKNTFYAVPATEVSHYNPAKSNETKQYRR